MNKQILKTKKFFILVPLVLASLIFLLLGSLGLAKNRIPQAEAVSPAKISKEIESEYAFGDKFVLPACTFEKDGQSVEGIASLQFPDGTQSNKTEVTLNQSGRYVLRYIATIAGKVYTQEYTFNVFGRLASYESDKTTMEYGACTALGANSTGLNVRIANGDSLTFNHVFEMNELTMATKLLEGFIVPDVQGTADFSRMVFTFTDVENPSVQLVYYGNFHNDVNAYGLTFFTAAGNGQVHCGLEHVGKLHVGSTLGCMVPHSFMSMDTGLYYGAQKPMPAAPDAKTFCISYDSKTNQAWAGGKIVSDLDDSNYYDSLWFGFPSGKAKLTISALNYNSATANMCFTSILGVDLSAENFIDKGLPVITVDTDYEMMPDGVVGKNYPVPTASAMDQVSGKCDVNVSVWYNYGDANQKMLDVVNGKFAVEKVGVYAIVYEAQDYSGNVAREVLWLRAKLSNYIPKLTVSIDEAYETTKTVGMFYELPEVFVDGGSGNKAIFYEIKKGQTVCDIVNGVFCLDEEGEWTLTCKAIDYVGNVAVETITLNGEISDKPIMLETPNFPIAYISGRVYELPTLTVYDYSSGSKVEKDCSISVEYAGEENTYKAGDSFTPVVETSGESLKIIYSCDGETVLKKEVPVIIVFGKERVPGATERYQDVIRLEEYFYTEDGFTFTNDTPLSNARGLLIQANQAMENATLSFINPQMANAFSLEFFTVPNESKFSKIQLVLTDSVDSSVSVTATLQKDEGQTLLTIGDTSISLLLDFDAATPTSFNVGFASGKFVVNSTTYIAVSKTDAGEAFIGFPSGKINFAIVLSDVEEGGSLFLNKICGINVNNKQDNSRPMISTMNSIEKNVFKDSIYTFQKMVVCDVLCPNVSATLTVVSPSGAAVTSTDGVTLSGADALRAYDVLMTEYGNYQVTVQAKESEGWKYTNQAYYTYTITVVDGEAPTIVFESDFNTKLSVGGVLEIPKYSVSDNHTAAENITVMITVTNPKGLPIYLYNEERAVRCEYAGNYRITILVLDEMGNLTTFETSVTVSEG